MKGASTEHKHEVDVAERVDNELAASQNRQLQSSLATRSIADLNVDEERSHGGGPLSALGEQTEETNGLVGAGAKREGRGAAQIRNLFQKVQVGADMPPEQAPELHAHAEGGAKFEDVERTSPEAEVELRDHAMRQRLGFRREVQEDIAGPLVAAATFPKNVALPDRGNVGVEDVLCPEAAELMELRFKTIQRLAVGYVLREGKWMPVSMQKAAEDFGGDMSDAGLMVAAGRSVNRLIQGHREDLAFAGQLQQRAALN